MQRGPTRARLPGWPGSRNRRRAPSTPALSAAELTAVVQRYCAVCHNDQLLTGNLSLQRFDVAAAPAQAATAEKMIVKLRAGMMPPPGAPRPSPDTLLELVETLERSLDAAHAAAPNPGSRMFQRLNRAESYPGAGMGLAIVRRAVERMSGRVGVTSTPGKGSRFWIDLLAAKE